MSDSSTSKGVSTNRRRRSAAVHRYEDLDDGRNESVRIFRVPCPPAGSDVMLIDTAAAAAVAVAMVGG